MTAKKKIWLKLAGVLLVTALVQASGMLEGYPISHAMADMPRSALAGVCLGIGILFGHWWCPARSCYPTLYKLVRRFGNPMAVDKDGDFTHANHAVRTHANRLWAVTEGEDE